MRLETTLILIVVEAVLFFALFVGFVAWLIITKQRRRKDDEK